MSNDMIIEKTKQLLGGHCAAELRTAAESYLEAVGTETEDAATTEYIFQLEDAITSIDDLIALTDSDAGKAIFGEEMAANLNAHGKEVKANGGEWCDCPACSLAIEILGLFDDEEGDAANVILTYEDGTTEECEAIGRFSCGETECIALVSIEHPEDGVIIYGFKGATDTDLELYDLTDEEYQAASDVFLNHMGE